jgi:hypothetical protein
MPDILRAVSDLVTLDAIVTQIHSYPVAYLEIWRGGGRPEYFAIFFRTQTNLQKIPVRKILTTFFSNFSHFFHFTP